MEEWLISVTEGVSIQGLLDNGRSTCFARLNTTVAIFSGACRYFSSFLCSELAPFQCLPRPQSEDCGTGLDPQTQSVVTAILGPLAKVINR